MIDAGADIIQTLTPPPCGDMDFDWLAKEVGGKVCLNGGMDTIKIRFGTPEEIERDVGYLLDSSDSLIEGSPQKNIDAFFRTAISGDPLPISTK